MSDRILGDLVLAVAAGTAVAFGSTASPAQAWADEPADALTFSVQGEGEVVALIPGLASPDAVWSDVADALEESYAVHTAQLAGFAGAAPRDWEGPVLDEAVDALIAHLTAHAPDGATVVGHSMGGFIGLLASLERPELFERLVIVDALPFYSVLFAGPNITVDAITPQAEALRDSLIAMDDAAFAAQQSQTAMALARSESAQDRVLAWSLATHRPTMAQAVYEIMTTDLRPRLAEASVPASVIVAWDPDGPFARDAVAAFWTTNYAAHPMAEVSVIDDARHFIMLDQPDAFLSVLQASIAQ